MTSPGVRTLVRYKSLPTRESLRVRSPERTQYAYSSAPSSEELREKKRPSRPSARTIVWRLCSQMLAPPHCLHTLLMRLCSQMLEPPHCLHALLRGLSYLDRSTGPFLSKGRTYCPSFVCQSPFSDKIPSFLFDSSFLFPKGHLDGGGPVKPLTLPPPTSQAPSLEEHLA